MTQLETLIQTLCPNGVKFVKLGDCCQILDSQRRPITKSQREAGEYPYYGANGIQDYVADFIFDGVFVLVGEDGSVLTPNGNPVVTWAEGKIWVNNHAHILAGTEIAQLRFLFYVLQTLSISHLVHGNIPKLTKKDLQELQIPLPPLAVQSEIVRILDKFTLYKSELAAELAARLQQYEYYRDQLLTFDDTVKRVKIQDVSTMICSGGTPSASNTSYYNGNIPWLRTQEVDWKDITDTSIKITELGLKNSSAKWIPENCVIVAMYGATAGKVAINKIPLTTNQACCNIKVDETKILYRFLFHYLCHSYKIIKRMGQGSQSNINAQMLKSFLIPLPPLSEQERIVSILDRFDKLCHDIREGLPAEIDLRQKQYEHYRDKLLTFEAKG